MLSELDPHPSGDNSPSSKDHFAEGKTCSQFAITKDSLSSLSCFRIQLRDNDKSPAPLKGLVEVEHTVMLESGQQPGLTSS